MAKSLFKGIKQVTYASFSGLQNADKVGYLWFVRTPILEGEETTSGNSLGNDAYDIYFGSQHYGHFRENEVGVLATAIGSIATAVGLGDDYGFSSDIAEAVSVTDAINKLNAKFNSYQTKISIAENDKILAFQDSILSGTVGLKYENGNITLTGKDNTEISSISASAFIKDGMLEDVSIVEASADNKITYEGTQYSEGKFIKFLWNTDGASKTDYIKVSELAQTYSAGTAIDLRADNSISVKVKAGTTDKPNFLKVDSNELAVEDINANKAFTTKDIPVTLDLGAGFTNGTVISAGTDIESILIKLLSRELWQTSTLFGTSSFSVSLASNPTVTVTPSSNVEVGDEITIGEFSAQSTNAATQSFKMAMFDYGYKLSADGPIVNASTYTKTYTPTLASESYDLKETFTGFNGAATKTSTDAPIASHTLYASEGSNKVTFSQSGSTYNSESASSIDFYVLTNLNNCTISETNSKPYIKTGTPTFNASVRATGSSSQTINAYYQIYTTDIDATTADTTLPDMEFNKAALAGYTKRPMSDATLSIPEWLTTDAKPCKVLVMPAKYRITSTQNSLGADALGLWREVKTFNYVNGNATTSYKVYLIRSTNAIMHKNITISKN